MSYILDALRESQQAREKRQVPGLTTVQQGEEETDHGSSRSGRTIRYVVGAVVLTAIAAGAGWWWGGQPQTSVADQLNDATEVAATTTVVTEYVAKEEPVPVSKPVESVKELAKVEVETQTSSSEPRTARQLTTDADTDRQEQPQEEIQESNIQESNIQESNIQESNIQESNIQESNTDDAKNAPQPVLKETIADVSATAENLTAETTTSDDQETAVSENTGSASGAETEPEIVPHFRELPYDIQQDLPPILYSVHLYSPNPAGRMVKIEGIMRREGDEVLPGVVLLEITPNGAVFVFRDHKFRVPVN